MNGIKDQGLRGLARMIIISMSVLTVLLILDFLDSVGIISFRMQSDWPSIVCAIMSMATTLFFAVQTYKNNRNI